MNPPSLVASEAGIHDPCGQGVSRWCIARIHDAQIDHSPCSWLLPLDVIVSCTGNLFVTIAGCDMSSPNITCASDGSGDDHQPR